MLRIKSVENKDLSSLAAFCENSLLGTKIMCQVNAYGIERDFLSVWCCFDENEKICAAICKFENSITLKALDEIGFQDIRTFLDMVGFGSLCCSYSAAFKLGYHVATSKKAYAYGGCYEDEALNDLTEEFYKMCYSLISKNIPGSFDNSEEAYLHFLSDFTYRKRRGLARLKGLTENGQVLACALTSAETQKAAIISGVACDAACRKKGLGKRTVLSLVDELKKEGKDVYVIALNESAEGFYEHIGFYFTEKISFIERQ